MAKQSNLLWVSEITQEYPNWLHAMTFPIKYPSAAALIANFSDFKLKEPQMSDEQPQTTVKDASERIIGMVNSLADQNAELSRRNINQRATIEKYQGQILELEQRLDLSEGAHQLTAEGAHRGSQASVPAEVDLKAKLERALHTQKILERDLEEYQQAYAKLRAETFENIPDEDLPPRLLEFGHGEYLVYPAKVCFEDDDQDPKWGIVVDPTVDVDVEEYLKPLAGKDVVLTDGDVAITFQKPEDVARLIHTLEDLRYRWFAGIFGAEEK